MSAYIRLIIGEKGKVLKVINDSLYHPDEQTKDFIEELFRWGGSSIDYVEEKISDSEVLIVFHPDTYQCNHPLDPVEYDTEIVIDQTIILQGNYKEHSRKQLEGYVQSYQGCSTPPTDIEDLIGEWEELFDEDFYQNKEQEVENEDDPFDVFKHEWKNTFTT